MLRVELTSLSSLPARIGTGGGPLVVMPFIDARAAQRAANQLAGRAGCGGLLLGVYDDSRAGFVTVVNRVFAASDAPHVAYLAQDAFAGRNWLATALAALTRAGAGLFAFNDGKWQGQLAAFGLVRRDWAAPFYDGGLFHPGYARHYGDAELTVLALAGAAFAYDPHAVLVEVDWDKDSSSVEPADRELYRRRASGGFDGRVRDPALLARFS
ncbi:MAG: hypothetical protein INF91_05490 [Alphaproteobacteria bacterium]|nr:hypothetical protein [Alphaproteobacteria bacterium]